MTNPLDSGKTASIREQNISATPDKKTSHKAVKNEGKLYRLLNLLGRRSNNKTELEKIIEKMNVKDIGQIFEEVFTSEGVKQIYQQIKEPTNLGEKSKEATHTASTAIPINAPKVNKQFTKLVQPSTKTIPTPNYSRFQKRLGPMGDPTVFNLIKNMQFPKATDSGKEQTFVDPNHLLYSYPAIKGLTSEKLFESISNVLSENFSQMGIVSSPEKFRALTILSFCQLWVNSNLYPEDLQSKQIQEQLRTIIKQAKDQPNPEIKQLAERLEKDLERAIKNLESQAPGTQTRTESSQITSVTKPDVRNKKSVKLIADEFDNLFREQTSKITFKELFVKTEISSKADLERLQKTAPNWVNSQNLINQTSGYVIDQIYADDDKNNVKERISNFILIAEELVKRGNYGAAFAIYSGLSATPISRLQKMLPKDSKKKIDGLDKLFSANGAFSELRNRMKADKSDAVIQPIFLVNTDRTHALEVPLMKDDKANPEQISVLASLLKSFYNTVSKVKQNPPQLKTSLQTDLKQVEIDEKERAKMNDNYYKRSLNFVPRGQSNIQ
jgi:hypothetical protein